MIEPKDNSNRGVEMELDWCAQDLKSCKATWKL